MLKLTHLLLTGALAFGVAARSQGQSASLAALDPAQEILLLAPQLQAFAGSPANFQSLASGLVNGTPIALTTTTSEGIAQTVTVTPAGPMSPVDAARALEAARQQLISRGVATPTAEQLAVSLMGGRLPTASGIATQTGVLSGNINSGGVQIQRQIVAVAPFAGSDANLQSLATGLTQGRPITLSSTSVTGVGQTVTFLPPGGPMSALEAQQALQLASQLLAAQGIVAPTPEQIRVALLGGTLNAANGSVTLRGVLENRGTTAVGSAGAIATAAPGNSSVATPAPRGAIAIQNTGAGQTIGASGPLLGASPAPALGASPSPVLGASPSAATAATAGSSAPAASSPARR